MSNLVITPASVAPVAGAGVNTGYNFGETITQGQAVYLNTTTSKWMKALANGTALQSGYGTLTGIALNAGSNGQPASVQTGGQITIGATMTLGVAYVISETAGDFCPVSDLVTAGDYFTWALFPISTTVAQVQFFASNTQHA